MPVCYTCVGQKCYIFKTAHCVRVVGIETQSGDYAPYGSKNGAKYDESTTRAYGAIKYNLDYELRTFVIIFRFFCAF